MINVNGVFSLLSIQRKGVDANGNAWCQVNAIARQDEKKENTEFFYVHLFGTQADFAIRNLTEARRAYITGELKVESYIEVIEIKTEVTVNCAKAMGIEDQLDEEVKAMSIVTVPVVKEVETVQYRNQLYPTHIEFLDKKRSDETTKVTTEDKVNETTTAAQSKEKELTPQEKIRLAMEAKRKETNYSEPKVSNEIVIDKTTNVEATVDTTIKSEKKQFEFKSRKVNY